MSNILQVGLNALLIGGIVGLTFSTLLSIGVTIYTWAEGAALATSLWTGFKLWIIATFLSSVLVITSIAGLAKLERN